MQVTAQVSAQMSVQVSAQMSTQVSAQLSAQVSAQAASKADYSRPRQSIADQGKLKQTKAKAFWYPRCYQHLRCLYFYQLYQKNKEFFEVTFDICSPKEILPKVGLFYISAACDACDKCDKFFSSSKQTIIRSSLWNDEHGDQRWPPMKMAQVVWPLGWCRCHQIRWDQNKWPRPTQHHLSFSHRDKNWADKRQKLFLRLSSSWYGPRGGRGGHSFPLWYWLLTWKQCFHLLLLTFLPFSEWGVGYPPFVITSHEKSTPPDFTHFSNLAG